mmetsp:Transcript_19693/g.27719  ORF Transcript_19693/g.27719 Transcript_19693/m.27719 type:complete len:168 (-) Transcript_19693:367-870(-)|eukprot:CAMPEP_0185251616 /NCGR_PEP_ID=MMETSP1359-20130426/982_1 /TAXON_ID=552665 /ORGANISM="Bigelowiella longifila, Strain CCMP242" /LENGTH=167 /DNA_ID=CAMNT_0027833581 /DNA_START=38 /DNA_END=541 /DNA_ORIENTATION=+
MRKGHPVPSSTSGTNATPVRDQRHHQQHHHYKPHGGGPPRTNHQAQQQTDPFVEHAVRTSLISFLDKRMLVVLRDGRNIVGNLSTFDRNANIVLVNARIREAVDKYYTDSKDAGVYVIRGDNVVMMGDVDPKLESRLEPVTKELLQKKAEELKAEGKLNALKILEDD